MRLRSGLARIWTRQAVLVQRPSAIRIDVLSPFGPRARARHRGDARCGRSAAAGRPLRRPGEPGRTSRASLGTPLAVGDLVDVLLGVPPARAADRAAVARARRRRVRADDRLRRRHAARALRRRHARRSRASRSAATAIRRRSRSRSATTWTASRARSISTARRGSTASVVVRRGRAERRDRSRRSFGPPPRRGVLPLDRAAAPAELMPLLSVEGLTMEFPHAGVQARAIDGVSFTVERRPGARAGRRVGLREEHDGALA